jgi:hypothetical protein
MPQDSEHYDIIGDIHGEYPALTGLLDGLGYRKTNGTWQHPQRRAVFVGDFIDRGRHQRQVLELVRPMIEAGHALAVLGNHEYNAIAWYTESASGGHLRAHSDKNRRQHQAFLDAYESHPDQWRELLDWFRTLPLWLDLDGLRVVHACWDPGFIRRLGEHGQDGRLTGALLHRSAEPGTWQFEAIETLLKGREIPLPEHHPGFHDKDGNPRRHIRVRWWDDRATTYRQLFLGPANLAARIPDDPLPGHHLVPYRSDDKPVFIGHYWLQGTPHPLAPNVGCVDYSVALPGGKLVAYRWDGERRLDPGKYFWR